MTNGRKMSIDEAKVIIKKFQEYELIRDANLNHLAIGQKFDLDLFKNFMAAIGAHKESAKINAVRVYLARSIRDDGNAQENFDVVLVPVLDDDVDLHRVYDKDPIAAEQDTIIGNGLPCPNVCPGNAFFC